MPKTPKYLLVLYAVIFSCIALFACEQENSDSTDEVSHFTPQTSENVNQENSESTDTVFPSAPQTDENVHDVISDQFELSVVSAMDFIKTQLQENYGQAELVCAISDYIAVNCRYDDTPGYAGSSVYAVFLNKRAICEGYANAFALLAQRLGLEVVKVSGIAKQHDDDSQVWKDISHA